MLSKTLTLVNRALRQDARQVRTHGFRGALVAVVLFLLYAAESDRWSGAPGLRFFTQLQLCNFWFITFAGVTFFATAVTEEREEQTLGLLRLAGIGPLAVLLGKWAPRMLASVALLSVQFPFTLLAITLGGVSWDQVIAAYAALLAHLLLVASAGLLASVVCVRPGTACTLATFMLGLFLLTAPLLAGAATMLGSQGRDGAAATLEQWADVASRTTAIGRIGEIVATGFSDRAIGVQVLTNVLGAIVMFGVSWGLFNVCTQHETELVQPGWLPRWMGSKRQSSRRPWTAACAWKDYYLVMGGPRGAVFRIVGYGLLLLVLAAFMESGRSQRMRVGDIGGMTIGVMLMVVLLETALIAARVFRYETAARTWPGLTLLPMARIELIRDKLLGCTLGLLPALGYLFLGVLLAPRLAGYLVEECLRDPDAFFAVNYLLTQVALFLHLTVLSSLLWNWGSWPVSILLSGLIVGMGNLMLIACASGGGGPAHGLFFVLWSFGAGSVVAVFMWIGVRLEYLAGS